MAAVNGIFLNYSASMQVQSAVSFSLNDKAKRSRTHHSTNSNWEVEIRSGCDSVVARTSLTLHGSALIDSAIEYAQMTLDLHSVEYGDNLITKSPVDNFVSFDCENGNRTVTLTSVSDVNLGVSADVVITKADGTVVPQPVAPQLAWLPAFRFYRLSQCSRDLFEAYRNLFLGLEAVFDHLFPKGKNEQEGTWIKRSMTLAASKVNLSQIAPPGSGNPVNDIFSIIYPVRLKLFHAKSGKFLMPAVQVSYLQVANAYPVLLSLWINVVKEWLSLSRGGGAITYQGFKMMIENSFDSTTMALTADDTSPLREETSVTQTDASVTNFQRFNVISEIRPGRMGIASFIKTADLTASQVVGRVAVLNSDKALIMIAVPGGLTLDGSDIFKTVCQLQLVNRDQPKTEFV